MTTKTIKVTSRQAIMLLYYFEFIEKMQWTHWENGKKNWIEPHEGLKKEIEKVLKKFN